MMYKQPFIPGVNRTGGAYSRSLRANAGIEKKFFDTNAANAGDMSAGVILNSVNLIPQGTTDQTRIGNKIVIKNFNFKLGISNDNITTLAFATPNIRVIVFVDKQCNGATAVVTDILKTASFSSFRNMDQIDRFQILTDQIYAARAVGTNAGNSDTGITWSAIYKKLNLDVHFSSTTGAITELRSNNIGLLYFADTSLANMNGTIRVKYIDL